MLTPRGENVPESWVHSSNCSKFEPPPTSQLEGWRVPLRAGESSTPESAEFRRRIDEKALQIAQAKAAATSILPLGQEAPQGAPHDSISAPSHYTRHTISAIAVIDSWRLNFPLGSVIKYINRHDAKGGLEDLRKAAWYLAHEIAQREKRGGEGGATGD
jgi:hypothetical protein